MIIYGFINDILQDLGFYEYYYRPIHFIPDRRICIVCTLWSLVPCIEYSVSVCGHIIGFQFPPSILVHQTNKNFVPIDISSFVDVLVGHSSAQT